MSGKDTDTETPTIDDSKITIVVETFELTQSGTYYLYLDTYASREGDEDVVLFTDEITLTVEYSAPDSHYNKILERLYGNIDQPFLKPTP